ncbi:variable surface lipoprotein [Metamycoplasma gateae]|uniref:Variable surface lipoprotein n=1 Tax=Metamycoplasma gateae TaxID=35769 RepID=A0ABZ2AHX5_9BACT|nr:variable surface lipoprotein [Metamycoplasma gateae]
MKKINKILVGLASLSSLSIIPAISISCSKEVEINEGEVRQLNLLLDNISSNFNGYYDKETKQLKADYVDYNFENKADKKQEFVSKFNTLITEILSVLITSVKARTISSKTTFELLFNSSYSKIKAFSDWVKQNNLDFVHPNTKLLEKIKEVEAEVKQATDEKYKEIKATLNEAIQAAKTVAGNENDSVQNYTNALTILETALNTFKEEKIKLDEKKDTEAPDKTTDTSGDKPSTPSENEGSDTTTKPETPSTR